MLFYDKRISEEQDRKRSENRSFLASPWLLMEKNINVNSYDTPSFFIFAVYGPFISDNILFRSITDNTIIVCLYYKLASIKVLSEIPTKIS